MIYDERGLPLSTSSAEAASLFDRSVEHWLKFHADTMALTGRMLAADPHFVMGHCFKGYLLLSASNSSFRAEVVSALAGRRGWRPSRDRARAAACRRHCRLGGRRARPVVRHMAAAAGRLSDRSAGGPHL